MSIPRRLTYALIGSLVVLAVGAFAWAPPLAPVLRLAEATGLVRAAPTPMTVTLTDALANDVDNDGNADPGDTIAYTLTITNVSGGQLDNVEASAELDASVSLVGGSVDAEPVARADVIASVTPANPPRTWMNAGAS